MTVVDVTDMTFGIKFNFFNREISRKFFFFFVNANDSDNIVR